MVIGALRKRQRPESRRSRRLWRHNSKVPRVDNWPVACALLASSNRLAVAIRPRSLVTILGFEANRRGDFSARKLPLRGKKGNKTKKSLPSYGSGVSVYDIVGERAGRSDTVAVVSPSSEPLGNGLHVHCELPLSAAGAYVHKAQEIEGCRFLPPLPCVLGCISPEFNQPRLLRVQSQTVFLEPLR